MPTLHDLQAAFRQALFNGREAAAVNLIVSNEITSEQRYGIYRNNIFGSLTEALTSAFPSVASILDEGLFAEIARPYIAAHPPSTPQLSAYGKSFADYLSDLEPIRDSPFLVDLARLDWARVESYFSPDTTPLDVASLKDVSNAYYPKVRFVLHPSVRIISTKTAVYDLWQKLIAGAVGRPTAIAHRIQNIQFRRPELTVESKLLSDGEAVLLISLCAGDTLEQAAARARAAETDCDLQRLLAEHLIAGTFSKFEVPFPDNNPPMETST